MESCSAVGTPDPEYTVLGDDLTVKFTARKGIDVLGPIVPKDQPDTLGDTLENRILKLLRDKPAVTQTELSKALGISEASIKRAMKKLSASGRINREGGKRFGYWEIKD